MISHTKILAILGPILLILLTGLASYAYTQTRLLSLPIPQALSLLTVLLPLVIGLSTRFIQLLIHPTSSPSRPLRPSLAILGILALQLIYETVIVTLTASYLVPSTLANCGLQEQWKHLFQTKNERRVRVIQDAFQCCGFRGSKDMAWPFPSSHNDAGECMRRLGSDRSCEGPWRASEQKNAGLLLLVAGIVFLLKVLAVSAILDNARARVPRWMKVFQHSINDDETADAEDTDPRAITRGLIEEGLEGGEQNLVEAAGTKDGDDDTDQRGRATLMPSALIADQGNWEGR